MRNAILSNSKIPFNHFFTANLVLGIRDWIGTRIHRLAQNGPDSFHGGSIAGNEYR
jgi:hypothetical protein